MCRRSNGGDATSTASFFFLDSAAFVSSRTSATPMTRATLSVASLATLPVLDRLFERTPQCGSGPTKKRRAVPLKDVSSSISGASAASVRATRDDAEKNVTFFSLGGSASESSASRVSSRADLPSGSGTVEARLFFFA